MKKLLFLFAVILASCTCFSQEVCTKQNESSPIVDVNELPVNKCAIEVKNNDSNVVEVNVQVTSQRFFKKRKFEKSEAEAIKINPLAHSLALSNNTLESAELKDIRSLVKQVAAIVVREEASEEIISFNEIEQIPQFKTCNDSLTSDSCFNNEMKKHIEEHFRYPQRAIDRGLEGEVLVSFVINTKGEVEKIKVTAPKEALLLKKEAQRIVSLLPKFTPAQHKGLKASVEYTFPMNFSLSK